MTTVIKCPKMRQYVTRISRPYIAVDLSFTSISTTIEHEPPPFFKVVHNIRHFDASPQNLGSIVCLWIIRILLRHPFLNVCVSLRPISFLHVALLTQIGSEEYVTIRAHRLCSAWIWIGTIHVSPPLIIEKASALVNLIQSSWSISPITLRYTLLHSWLDSTSSSLGVVSYTILLGRHQRRPLRHSRPLLEPEIVLRNI